MDEPILRLLLVLGVVALALGVARAWPRLRAWRTARSPIRLEGLGPWPAVLLFTSGGCDSCEPARRLVEREAGAWPVRELSFEEDPERFTEAGVDAVPLVTVVDRDGRVVGQFAGVPDRRAFRRVLRAAGD